ncbi:MAG: hypothetical protein H6713_30960 [Myxococcales bacterium]|nr:hypothetical protein [Myxococcales bacterium]
MTRFRITTIVVACLALAPACDQKSSSGSNPPGVANNANGGGGAGQPVAGGPSPGGPGPANSSGGGVAAPPPCTVELDDAPTGFFNKRLAVTLPKGVELVEQNPFFALVERNDIPSSCGATLHFAAVGYVRPSGTTAEIRDQLLSFRGIPPEQISGWEQEADDGTNYTAVYNASASGGAPAIKGLLTMRRGGEGAMYFVIYEATPAAWSQIEPSLRASLADVSVR